MSRFVITTLAEYQTRFWTEVGTELRGRGHEALFVSFDSRSNELLADAGLGFIDATRAARERALGDQDALTVCRGFGVENPIDWITHEKFAFGLTDSDALVRKLAGTLAVIDLTLRDFAAGGDYAMVQELGGFLSVFGAHFAAQHAGKRSWFIEPSFFRGRMLFIEGGVQAFQPPNGASAAPEGDVADYLTDTLERALIVIPEKDRHHYVMPFRKMVNRRNLRRLAEKVIDKHLLGKQQEFGHIGGHVGAHARMIVASRQLSREYTPLQDLRPFVYYPLHVPGDVALTIRSPEYLDQIALLDYLCRVTPLQYRVAAKEHPAMVGAMGSGPLLGLKRRYDRFHIIPPSTNNFDVLREASAVVTVNSKSGAEAGLLGRRVIVLGDAFYRNAPFARPVDRLAELGAALREILEPGITAPNSDAVWAYFAALWPRTLPGELYALDKSNIVAFTTSLVTGTGADSISGRQA